MHEHEWTEDSSLNLATEYAEKPFELFDGDGIETAPIAVYTLPTDRKFIPYLDHLRFDLLEVSLTSESVKFVSDSVTYEYRPPAFGETLVIQADEDEHIVGYLDGEPEVQTLEVALPNRKEFFDQVKSVLWLMIWIGTLILLGMAGVAIYKWRKGRAMTRGISKITDNVLSNILKKFT
ncbi:MAG: hypothetical protein OXI24_05665 [Candidatus Poribacteria bacterium]|nr:hypothetical protein [Candidatus Poribacteria bacterium]